MKSHHNKNPYGGPLYNFSSNQGFQPYKYNGRSALCDASHLKKELDRVHGLDWYDYGARRYDPAYCMFTQMDPLAEKYPHLSPYAYCAGNPVNAIDPDGKKVVFVNGYLGLGSPEGGALLFDVMILKAVAMTIERNIKL